MVYLLNPDDLSAMSLGVVFSGYWPMIVGAFVLFLLVVNGFHRLTIPVVGASMLIQAWHSGVLG